jgi:hypothetical protein
MLIIMAKKKVETPKKEGVLVYTAKPQDLQEHVLKMQNFIISKQSKQF